MDEYLTDEEIQERARKIMEERPYSVEMWENGTPSQRMLVKNLKMMAGVG